ncbi:MAG TPA: hypothetical protein VEL07_08265 [Planctomycetota bacterium]|nr:hypothetical protein [Planctomycetota bacterium]
MSRMRWIAVAVAALALLAWWMWWRSAAVQAPRTFAALAQALADGDASRVLGRVHDDYDFRARWPDLFGGDDFGVREPRKLAFFGLRQVLEQHRDDPIRCAWEIHAIDAQDDGGFAVVATLRFSTAGGGGIKAGPSGPLERHRFILAREGWSAALFFLAHDPIAATR